MRNYSVFLKAMFTKGNWKNSGKTNKDINNGQRMWIALCFIISGIVTLITLGRITCWADIFMGLQFASQGRKSRKKCNHVRLKRTKGVNN